MKSTLLVLAILSTPFSAFAYDHEDQVQNVVVKCHGIVDNKFTIHFQSDIPVEAPDQAVSQLEVGLILKTWEPARTYNYEEVYDITKKNVELEGSVSAGAGDYKVKLPWGDDYFATTQSFSTALTLKTSLYTGKVKVNCDATLRTVKQKTHN